MVTTADPVDDRSEGSPAVADEMMVGNAKPTPTPPISHPGRNSSYDGCAPTLALTIVVPTANKTHPIAVSTPDGTRPDSRCATPVKIGTITGPGAIARPVCSADQPHTFS